MQKINKYICEYCHTEYSTEDACLTCETNHKTPTKITRCIYNNSIRMESSGKPTFIEVRFSDNSINTYRLYNDEPSEPAEGVH